MGKRSSARTKGEAVARAVAEGGAFTVYDKAGKSIGLRVSTAGDAIAALKHHPRAEYVADEAGLIICHRHRRALARRVRAALAASPQAKPGQTNFLPGALSPLPALVMRRGEPRPSNAAAASEAPPAPARADDALPGQLDLFAGPAGRGGHP